MPAETAGLPDPPARAWHTATDAAFCKCDCPPLGCGQLALVGLEIKHLPRFILLPHQVTLHLWSKLHRSKPNHPSPIEHGELGIGAAMLSRTNRGFGMSLDWLLTGEGHGRRTACTIQYLIGHHRIVCVRRSSSVSCNPQVSANVSEALHPPPRQARLSSKISWSDRSICW